MLGILVWIVVGAIAGFVASKVLSGKGMGLLWDIVVGILGAFLGGWLASLAGLPVSPGTFTVGGLLSAFVGAVILLVVFRALTHRGMIHS
ncbi:MAG TPA: GlsB/YeaQ/YmgE family stress response membrane protein [Candidatus Dormibacteraeota bacterium]